MTLAVETDNAVASFLIHSVKSWPRTLVQLRWKSQTLKYPENIEFQKKLFALNNFFKFIISIKRSSLAEKSPAENSSVQIVVAALV